MHLPTKHRRGAKPRASLLKQLAIVGSYHLLQRDARTVGRSFGYSNQGVLNIVRAWGVPVRSRWGRTKTLA